MSAAIRRAARPGTSGGMANRRGGMLERYSERKGQFRKSSVHAVEDAASLPREYANCKNRPWLFRKAPTIFCKSKVGRHREQVDEGQSVTGEAGRPRTQPAVAGGPTRARRGRSAPPGGRGQRQISASGISRPEGARTDPLRRLGKERHRLGFLKLRA